MTNEDRLREAIVARVTTILTTQFLREQMIDVQAAYGQAMVELTALIEATQDEQRIAGAWAQQGRRAS
jgi:hypothetical protein